MNEITDALAEQLKGKEINGIVGLESRGFIFGVPLALKLGISFIMARKPFKLPGPNTPPFPPLLFYYFILFVFFKSYF